MLRFTSIKENREFMFLYRKGDSFCADCLVIYVRKNKNRGLRLGITVTKKIGKAVVRNRIRRRIRESFSANSAELAPCYDIIIVARSKAAKASFAEINRAMRYLFHKAGLM